MFIISVLCEMLKVGLFLEKRHSMLQNGIMIL